MSGQQLEVLYQGFSVPILYLVFDLHILFCTLDSQLSWYDVMCTTFITNIPRLTQLIDLFDIVCFLTQAFTMDCYFRQVWTDKRLAMKNNATNTTVSKINNSTETNVSDFIQLSIKVLKCMLHKDVFNVWCLYLNQHHCQ